MILIDCKLCGYRHRAGDCPVESIVAGPPTVKTEPLPPPSETRPDPVQIPTAASIKAAYNEYMKLLMRERRGGLKRKPKP